VNWNGCLRLHRSAACWACWWLQTAVPERTWPDRPSLPHGIQVCPSLYTHSAAHSCMLSMLHHNLHCVLSTHRCAAPCRKSSTHRARRGPQSLRAWRQRLRCTHQAVGHRGWQTLSRTPGPRVAGTARQWRDTCPACADNLITRCVSVCAQHSCHLRQACGLDASGPGHCLRKLCTALPCAQARHRAASRDGRNPQELGSYTVVASRALVTDGHESKQAR